MAAAKIQKSLLITTKNEVGVVAAISSALSEKGVNLLAISGWVERSTGKIRVVAEDTAKAAGILKEKNYAVEERDAILIDVPHKVGSLSAIANKIKASGVNINHIYATADPKGATSLIVLSSSDNAKILKALG